MMDINYSAAPFRPAGGVWTSAHDMARYMQLELSKGKLPNGEQFVSADSLLMRRKPKIAWNSNVASRRNDGRTGYEFVRAARRGKRALIIRDGQHEYVFSETSLGKS